MTTTCSVEGCDRTGRIVRSMCGYHYDKQRRQANRARYREWHRQAQRRRRGLRNGAGRCCVCNGDFAVKLDGAIREHHTIDGPVCDGSDRMPSHLVTAALRVRPRERAS